MLYNVNIILQYGKNIILNGDDIAFYKIDDHYNDQIEYIINNNNYNNIQEIRIVTILSSLIYLDRNNNNNIYKGPINKTITSWVNIINILLSSIKNIYLTHLSYILQYISLDQAKIKYNNQLHINNKDIMSLNYQYKYANSEMSLLIYLYLTKSKNIMELNNLFNMDITSSLIKIYNYLNIILKFIDQLNNNDNNIIYQWLTTGINQLKIQLKSDQIIVD